MDNDQVVFGDKKKMNSSISDYFMLQSVKSEKDSDELFTTPCNSCKVRYFDGNSIKTVLLSSNGDSFGKL